MRFAAWTLAALTLLLCGAGSALAATSGPSAYTEEAEQLEQRVLDIAAQVPRGKFPLGTGTDGKLRFVSGSDWTSGFWASTLWRLSDLTQSSEIRGAAMTATSDHFGFEDTQLHDLGFMYMDSSGAALSRTCAGDASLLPDCAPLRQSTAAAAQTLLNLAGTTGQGIIPMSNRTCSDCPAGSTETIVDSMMNLPLLYWASRNLEHPGYRRLARSHADWVARNLQRSDGSTYQAGRYRRAAQRPRIDRHTHQGLSDTSVWARGQAWSLYGFADAGKEFKSRKFLAVAERNAAYISKHLPADGLPLWDYRARRGDPRDVSAGVITAAGLFHLTAACRAVKQGCKQPRRWAPLARRVLTGSLSRIRIAGPAGYLGNQVYTRGGRSNWDDDAELIFGLNYALEAIQLARTL